MASLQVIERVHIACPADLVRRQFADVEHHAATGVHDGVVFAVTSDDGDICRYRQTTAVGPLRLVQDFELARTEEGPLVNRIVHGQFRGGSITFAVAAAGTDESEVTATLEAPATGPRRLLAPVLPRIVARALRAALEEDRIDLESGQYG